MKSPLFNVFIVASAVVAIAHSSPLAHDDREDSSEENGGVDTVLVLPNRRNPPFAIPRSLFRVPDLTDLDDDDSSLEGFNPSGIDFNPFSSNPLDGFLESMQTRSQLLSAMNTINRRMAGVLSGIPGLGAFVPWGKTPEGGNTTSTTKIIDGHIVTVNETTYQNSDNNSNTVFRVRIVDVKPLNGTDEGSDGTEGVGGLEEIETVTSGDAATTNKQGKKEETTTQARSVETVEDFADNKIPNNSQDDNLTA